MVVLSHSCASSYPRLELSSTKKNVSAIDGFESVRMGLVISEACLLASSVADVMACVAHIECRPGDGSLEV